MAEPYADTLATVAARRTAFIARLQALATRVEQLPVVAAQWPQPEPESSRSAGREAPFDGS
jgi:hypothetical protein